MRSDKSCGMMVARDGIEPPTPAFSGLYSPKAKRLIFQPFTAPIALDRCSELGPERDHGTKSLSVLVLKRFRCLNARRCAVHEGLAKLRFPNRRGALAAAAGQHRAPDHTRLRAVDRDPHAVLRSARAGADPHRKHRPVPARAQPPCGPAQGEPRTRRVAPHPHLGRPLEIVRRLLRAPARACSPGAASAHGSTDARDARCTRSSGGAPAAASVSRRALSPASKKSQCRFEASALREHLKVCSVALSYGHDETRPGSGSAAAML